MERAVVIVPEGKIRMRGWSGAARVARLHVDARLPLFLLAGGGARLSCP